MNHIPTTATTVQKLKRLAKNRRKASGESLAAAQDAIAREHGYRDWKHVTVCLAASTAATSSEDTLPDSIRSFLAARKISHPASPGTAHAIAKGLVFAMDVKDADNARPESDSKIQECDDANPFLAGDIWRALLRHEREEGLREREISLKPDEELQQFFDELGNYRFFRHTGTPTPTTLDEAFAGPFRDLFFPPTHVWIEGKFFDMAAHEVRVDGRSVYVVGGK